MNKREVTGIVLAGGVSSRMGTDKGLCMLKGKTLVSYAIEALLPLCDTILISSNNIIDYQNFGYQVIVDEYKGIGPIGGIYSSLKKSPSKHNLIISCDTPFLNTSLLSYILENSDNYEIVAPEHSKSFIEPLAAYYSSDIVNQLEISIKNKDYKLMNFFNKVKFKKINISSIQGFSNRLFINLNTPDDLLLC